MTSDRARLNVRGRRFARTTTRALLTGLLGLSIVGCGDVSSSKNATSDKTDTDKTPGLVQDWPLPATPLVDVATGQTVLLNQLQQPMLVNFWASWCRPCLQEIPDLKALAADPALGVRVVGVAMDSGNRHAVQAFARQHDMHYRLLNANRATLDTRYGLVGFPITYLVDAKGVVRRRLVGPQSAAAFRAAIHTLD